MPGPAVKVTAVVPSVVAVGESFPIKVRFEDRDSNPRAPYTGKVRFECDDPEAVLPPEYEFTADDDGWHVFEGCRLGTEGVWRIRVVAAGLPVALSNPVACQSTPQLRVYWGDMHNHTQWCDGTDTVEYVYQFARDQAFLDVCSCSEHISNQPPDWPIEVIDKPPASSAALWAEEQKQTQAYNDPGRFVTFLGYEFTPSVMSHPDNADHCIWFLDDNHPLVIHDNIEVLGKMLLEHEAVMAAHVGGRFTKWQYEVPAEVMPIVEIASMHAHAEWFVQQALQKGLKMGIVAMSDGHMGRPGYDVWARHGRSGLRKRAFSVQSGITAFLAPALDRPSIWEAIKSRRVYATTGARILLYFSCADAVGGQEVTVSGTPQFHIRVHGTAPLDRVQIIRRDRLAHTFELSPVVTGKEPVWDAELTWTDPRPLAAEAYYYVRVTQSDNHFAWSSPIWVTCTTGMDPAADGLPPWNEDIWPPYKEEDVDYMPRIKAHLKQRGCDKRFVELEQVGVFEEPRGRYVLVRGRDAERGMRPMHLHYYLGFDDERLYVSAGWADYGQMSNI